MSTIKEHLFHTIFTPKIVSGSVFVTFMMAEKGHFGDKMEE